MTRDADSESTRSSTGGQTATAADELDDQVQALLEAFPALPEWSTLSVESARQVEDDLFGATDPPAVDRVFDIAVDGSDGAIPLRIYHPAVGETRPALCFFHGGLWALGTLDSIDGVCRRLARRSGRVVVSVDYRLAPEQPFPAGLEDCVAATGWVVTHGSRLEIDTGHVAVGGTSAGGNLAAATCLVARERADLTLDGQLLCYPMTDRSVDYPSYDDHGEGPLLTRSDVRWAHEAYLDSPLDGYNPLAAPLRAQSHRELPRALVVTAGFDVLRDEGAAYARLLTDAGVDVSHDHEPAMPHGFLSLTQSVDAADEALDRVADWLRG